MRIAEMSQRVVLAEPVEIELRRTRYVPANREEGVLEHWEAAADGTEPEVVGLRFDNAAFALMAEFFGGASEFTEALLGKPYAMMEPDRDDEGNVKVDEEGTPLRKQAFGPDGEPLGGFDTPANRAKVVQQCIAILTHRDERAIGAAMYPDLLEVYYASLLIAMQIGRGVDPSIAEESVRVLLPACGINLAADVNAEARKTIASKTIFPSPNGPEPSSVPAAEAPSPSSGA